MMEPDHEMIALEAGLADLLNEWECPEDRDYAMQGTDCIEWSGTRQEVCRGPEEQRNRWHSPDSESLHWSREIIERVHTILLRDKIRDYYRRIHDTAVLGLTPAEDYDRVLEAVDAEAARVARMSPEIQRAYLAAHEVTR